MARHPRGSELSSAGPLRSSFAGCVTGVHVYAPRVGRDWDAGARVVRTDPSDVNESPRTRRTDARQQSSSRETLSRVDVRLGVD